MSAAADIRAGFGHDRTECRSACLHLVPFCTGAGRDDSIPAKMANRRSVRSAPAGVFRAIRGPTRAEPRNKGSR
jgi:hypothetical protein